MEEKYATSSIYKYMDDRWRAQFPTSRTASGARRPNFLSIEAAIKGEAISIEMLPW